MARRFEDYETPTEQAAAGFEAYYGDLDDDRDLDRRDAKRDEFDGSEQARREYWKAVREGRAA